MTRIALIQLLCILFLNGSYSQTTPSSIGQIVDKSLYNMSLTAIDGKPRINNLAGKKIIIHFWATWCAACIRDMPLLDSLQAANKEDLCIVLVTYEGQQEVDRLRKRNQSFAQTKLSMIISDTLLSLQFPYNSLPHNIWIAADGKVEAITSSSALTETNMRSFLNNLPLTLAVKKDIMDRDFRKPLLLGGLGQQYQFQPNNLIASSVLTGYIDGLVSVSTDIQKNGKTLKFLCSNHSITDLFRATFLIPENQSPETMTNIVYERLAARTILEVRDSTLLWWPGKSRPDWDAIPDSKKIFSFEVLLPGNDTTQMLLAIRQELNRLSQKLWGISATIEKRKVDCWALQQTRPGMIPRSQGGVAEIEKIADNTINVNNMALDYFLFFLMGHDFYRVTVPVINETACAWPIDLQIKGDFSKPETLNHALAPSGLAFRKVERVLDMLVIRDADQISKNQ